MLFSHQSKTGKTSDMISPPYIYPSSNNLLPIQSFNYCEDAVMKGIMCDFGICSPDAYVLSVHPVREKLLIQIRPLQTQFINWHRYPRRPPLQLPLRNKYILAPFNSPPASLINQKEIPHVGHRYI